MTAAVEGLLALVEEYGREVDWGNRDRAKELLAQIDAAATRLADTEQATRERVAAYLDRAAQRLRPADPNDVALLGDQVRANALAEAAGWCRDDTIWADDDEKEN